MSLYSNTVLADGPVGYWRLGDLGSVIDSSGNGNSGNWIGSPTLASPALIAYDTDPSVTLDGATQYVDIPDSTSLDFGDTFSLEAWVKMGAPLTNRQVISKGAGAPGLFFDSGGVFTLSKAGTGTIAQFNVGPGVGQTCHVVATKNGSDIHCWINGADQTVLVNTALACTNTATNLNLGRNTAATNYFAGVLDEVAIYPTALTAEAVKRHWLAGSVGSPQLPAWRFIIVDAQNGQGIGEPLATGRALTFGVSQAATASFRVKAGTSLWNKVAAGDAMLKVYDSSNTLRFFGEIVQDELSTTGQGGSVSVTCSDLSWRLKKRFTGRDLTGVGTTYTDTDSGTIIFSALADVNAQLPATGISAGNKDTFLTRTITVLWKNMLDLLAELGSISSSYEWVLRYVDGTPPSVYLDLLTRVGQDRSGSVFYEYGMGQNNCQTYQRVRSMETSATRVFAMGSAQTQVTEAFSASDESVRRLEDVVTYSDITTPSLIDALAAAHVAFRSRPRITATFTPSKIGAPLYGRDFTVGDFVTARAVVEHVLDLNGVARIWTASVVLDESGNETSSPSMEPN